MTGRAASAAPSGPITARAGSAAIVRGTITTITTGVTIIGIITGGCTDNLTAPFGAGPRRAGSNTPFSIALPGGRRKILIQLIGDAVERLGVGGLVVVRYTEPDLAIVSCFKPVDAPCAIRPCCVLRRALEKARDAFMAVLEDYTLGDLVKPRARLASLLGISQAGMQG
jgi:hypothetical protein